MLCVRALVLSLSLSFLWSSLVFSRFRSRFRGSRRRREERGRWRREREREIPRRRRHSRCPFGSFKRDLDGTKIGDEKMSNTTTRVLINTGTNDDVRFLSPFTKFSLRRSERKRETKEGLALARSFVRVTRVCDILKNILLDGRLTRQKM